MTWLSVALSLGGLGILGGLAAAAVLMPSVGALLFAFFQTRLGRWIAGVAAGAGMLLLAGWRLYAEGRNAGRSDERGAVDRANAQAVTERKAIEAEVAKAPDDELRAELTKWSK